MFHKQHEIFLSGPLQSYQEWPTHFRELVHLHNNLTHKIFPLFSLQALACLENNWAWFWLEPNWKVGQEKVQLWGPTSKRKKFKFARLIFSKDHPRRKDSWENAGIFDSRYPLSPKVCSPWAQASKKPGRIRGGALQIHPLEHLPVKIP